jgi:hypothetical protein
MKRTTLLVTSMALVAALGGAATAAAGQPARTMAALADRVEPGTEVDVVDRQGRILRGGFAGADGDGVLITAYGSAEGRRIPAEDVMSVTRQGDSLKNGALIGAAIGALSAMTLSIDTPDSPSLCSADCLGMQVFVTAAYTGIGMLVDRAIKGREVVYRAPAERLAWSVTPHPVPRGVGVRLAVKF